MHLTLYLPCASCMCKCASVHLTLLAGYKTSGHSQEVHRTRKNTQEHVPRKFQVRFHPDVLSGYISWFTGEDVLHTLDWFYRETDAKKRSRSQGPKKRPQKRPHSMTKNVGTHSGCPSSSRSFVSIFGLDYGARVPGLWACPRSRDVRIKCAQ